MVRNTSRKKSSRRASGSPPKHPLVSVVLSFYNEEAVIGELIDRIVKALSPLPIRFEMIFVNDASVDRSLQILEERASTDDRIKILNMSRNFGRYRQGCCTIAGFEHASGDAVIMMDTDLQDPPEILPEMIRAWQEGEAVDVVHTRRRKRLGESIPKRVFTWLGYRFLKRIFDIRLPVDAGDFKLLSRRAVKHILSMGDQWPFPRGMVAWVGFKSTFVEYERLARFAGETHYPFISGRTLHHHLHAVISFSSIPLLFCFWAGLFSVVGSMIFLGGAIVGELAPVPALQGTLGTAWLTFFGSVHLSVTGLLGLHVLFLWEQSRGRPRYIVESRVGFGGEEA